MAVEFDLGVAVAEAELDVLLLLAAAGPVVAVPFLPFDPFAPLLDGTSGFASIEVGAITGVPSGFNLREYTPPSSSSFFGVLFGVLEAPAVAAVFAGFEALGPGRSNLDLW